LEGRRGRGKVAQTIYTHVSKCKNDKRRKKKDMNFLLEVRQFSKTGLVVGCIHEYVKT
jgi:hypothetical protein